MIKSVQTALLICFFISSCASVKQVPKVKESKRALLIKDRDRQLRLSPTYQKFMTTYFELIDKKYADEADFFRDFRKHKAVENSYGIRFKVLYKHPKRDLTQRVVGFSTSLENFITSITSVPESLRVKGYKISEVKISAHNNEKGKLRGMFNPIDEEGRFLNKKYLTKETQAIYPGEFEEILKITKKNFIEQPRFEFNSELVELCSALIEAVLHSFKR